MVNNKLSLKKNKKYNRIMQTEKTIFNFYLYNF